ncbi:hypothetical protein AMS68_007931 [Peltaster fructicola]|uniref:Uncharacterized protein n=1 Tax=Peltaster fructicola TaxID=286661 RepID=A0A6H0Y5W7_9PEZI|nr:hypothetical protein AMS68_007931 [Peltaster fructicola]
MSIDLRPLFASANQTAAQQVLEEQALRAEILWTFIILLHFAALIPLNPLVVHLFVVLLNWAIEKAKPMLEAEFYDSLASRLHVDSATGVRRF